MSYCIKRNNIFIKVIATILLALIIIMHFVTITAVALNAKKDYLCATSYTEATTRSVVLSSTPILFPDVSYETFYDIASCNNFLENAELYIWQLNDSINSGLFTSDACDIMVKERARLENIINKVKSYINTITAWENEYYYATKTWIFLKQNGYSDIVASAIISNMMVETAGGTLDLEPNLYDYSGDYYGLCQWSLYYRPEVADMSFEAQLEYLQNDIEKEFNVFGNCYKKGFTFEDFLAMDDVEEASLAFAKVYERCATWSYAKRVKAAPIAYDYFNLQK
jgi:hypothetical protein